MSKIYRTLAIALISVISVSAAGAAHGTVGRGLHRPRV